MASNDILENLHQIEVYLKSIPAQQKAAFRKLRLSPTEMSSKDFFETYIRPLSTHRRNPEHQEERRLMLYAFSQYVLGGA